MIDKSTTLQIFGSLLKHPQFLSQTDRYNLTPEDFHFRLDKFIFVAIDSLYRDGATHINPIDVENYLSSNEQASILFRTQNGIEYLQDADYLADEESFPYYYKKLKKFNLLEVLKGKGIDTSQYFVEEPLTDKELEINAKFEDLEINDILAAIKTSLVTVERKFIENDTTQTQMAFTGIEEIIEGADRQDDIGKPVQGDIFNEVMSGARRGTLVVRSLASGAGKTRSSVGDACYLAFPLRYSTEKGKWEQVGSNEKVLVVVTEQSIKEIQRMILAYITGFNETRFRFGDFSEKEKDIITQALWVMKTYQENFYIVQMPNPTIELIKTIVRENVLLHDIGYVFYDYIFIGPAVLSEFAGFKLRNDEILLMMATALKDLAVELNVFVMTSTQVNAKADNNEDIRNESSIAGSRAIINKADIGVIAARPSKEELDFFSNGEDVVDVPTLVTDVYKVRSGQWTQVRIWSDANLGNLRKKDLFVTDNRMEIIPNVGYPFNLVEDWESEQALIYREQLKELENIKFEKKN